MREGRVSGDDRQKHTRWERGMADGAGVAVVNELLVTVVT